MQEMCEKHKMLYAQSLHITGRMREKSKYLN